jgi:hypothetical protein
MMRLRARSPLVSNQVIDVMFVDDETAPHPVIRTEDGLQMMLASALTTYEVIDASPSERAILARTGFPFGGRQ